MHLRSNRVFVQTATAPLVRHASVTTSQELNSVTAQGNCQSKTFHTDVTTNRPSKSCQIPHTTCKYFNGHNTFTCSRCYLAPCLTTHATRLAVVQYGLYTFLGTMWFLQLLIHTWTVPVLWGMWLQPAANRWFMWPAYINIIRHAVWWKMGKYFHW